MSTAGRYIFDQNGRVFFNCNSMLVMVAEKSASMPPLFVRT